MRRRKLLRDDRRRGLQDPERGREGAEPSGLPARKDGQGRRKASRKGSRGQRHPLPKHAARAVLPAGSIGSNTFRKSGETAENLASILQEIGHGRKGIGTDGGNGTRQRRKLLPVTEEDPSEGLFYSVRQNAINIKNGKNPGRGRKWQA